VALICPLLTLKRFIGRGFSAVGRCHPANQAWVRQFSSLVNIASSEKILLTCPFLPLIWQITSGQVGRSPKLRRRPVASRGCHHFSWETSDCATPVSLNVLSPVVFPLDSLVEIFRCPQRFEDSFVSNGLISVHFRISLDLGLYAGFGSRFLSKSRGD
jgi:hypothetical protein